MSVIGAGVSLQGLYIEEWAFVFNLKAGIVKADEGKAVSIDTAAANTVKLATDGERILGRLEVVEDRGIEGVLVGTVMLKGGLRFPLGAAEVVAVGDTICGDGTTPGMVRKLAVSTDDATISGGAQIHASHDNTNVVVEVGADYVVALML